MHSVTCQRKQEMDIMNIRYISAQINEIVEAVLPPADVFRSTS